jgi:CheY-like chemotaxis protein/HPt (histidine-containing phosphotransfer) domain-containing protein
LIEDSGIGIPADKLDFIFLGFQRIDSDLNRKYSGTGLGLTIVEQLVKLQGGKISVESVEGKGSTFIFSLPFTIGEQKSPIKANGKVEKSRALEGVQILLVEDNLLNQMVTEHLLSDWGVEVTIASNGQIALNLLTKQDFDLILMDLQMPVMDGYDTTRHIRNGLKGKISQIPIIALTANAFYGMDDECMKIGMNDYLSKPFEKDVLFAKIKACIPLGMQNRSNAASTNYSQESLPANNPNNFESINLTYLREVSSGDEFIFNLAINKYLENTPEGLELIDEYLLKENYVELGRSVHKLKSSVATMGMVKAKDTIIQIENIIRNDLDKHILPVLVKTLRGSVEKSFQELRSVLGKKVM